MATNANIFEAAAALMSEQYADQYQAFAGPDITPYIGNVPIGTLQAVHYSSARETGSLYAMGSPNVKAFVRGKRALSGSLVFTQFDRDIILKIMEVVSKTKTPASPGRMTIGEMLGVNSAADVLDTNFENLVSGQSWGPTVTGPGSAPEAFGKLARENLTKTLDMVLNRPFKFADQMPPFNITVTMANEKGGSASQSFHGVILVNQAGGYTVDDLQSQVAYTFLCRDMTPLTPGGNKQAKTQTQTSSQPLMGLI